jgi:hypothetical protein
MEKVKELAQKIANELKRYYEKIEGFVKETGLPKIILIVILIYLVFKFFSKKDGE